jgi:tetratricopeptide (TPR) repeat protein
MIRTGFCHRPLGSAIVVLAMLGAATAQAAPSTATPPGPATTSTPATASAAGEEASNHFKRGLQLFDDNEYTLALVEFERAYQLAPNYRALYNIALVDMQLGRYADAARTLDQYVRDGGDAIPPARRAEVAKALGELKLRTATIDIALNVTGAEVALDGKLLDPARLRGPMVIDAGEHTLRATASGYLASDRTLTLAGGDRASVRLELRTVSQLHPEGPPPRTHAIFWPGFVVAGALGAGAIASGIVALDAHARWNTLENTPGSNPAQRQSEANTVNTANLAADIMTGLAVVAGGISIYLSLGPEHTAKTPSVAVSPQKVVLSMPF